MHPQPQMVSYLVAGLMIVVVMALRLRNVGRERRLRLETLWIVPALLLALTILTFVQGPPTPLALAVSGLALVLGAALGWQRGRLMRIHLDPATHELRQATSGAAMVFLVAIVAVRLGARAIADSGLLPVHVDPRAMSDVLLSFALGMFGVARLEMFLRARRMLAGARAAPAG